MEEIKLGALIDKIYRKLKDRGLYLLLYAAAFIPCAFIALNSAFPAFDDLAASEGTLFASVLAGHEWQGEIFVADTRGGYLWSALYTPAMFLFDTATLRFRAMFLFNAAVLSFAPVLAYRLTFRLNVTLAWQRFLLAGASISPVLLSSVTGLSGEAYAAIYPWLIANMLLLSGKIRRKRHKVAFAALCGLVAGFSTAFNAVCVLTSIGVVAALVIFSLLFKKSFVQLGAFVPAWLFFAAAERATAVRFYGIGDRILPSLPTGLQFQPLLKVLLGNLFHVNVITFGAASLAVFLISGSLLRRDRHKKETLFLGIFVLAVNFSALVYSVFSSDVFYGAVTQESYLTNGSTENVAPLFLFLTFAIIFANGFDLSKLLGATALLGAVFTLFFSLVSADIISIADINSAKLLALAPLSPTEHFGNSLGWFQLICPASLTLSCYAVLIAFVCCSKKHRMHIISFTMCLSAAYAAVFTCFVSLPEKSRYDYFHNLPLSEITDQVYNSSESPTLLPFRMPEGSMEYIRFFNPSAKIADTGDDSVFPLDCFVVAPNKYVLTDGAVTAVGSQFTLYAYGEKAVAFAKSQEN